MASLPRPDGSSGCCPTRLAAGVEGLLGCYDPMSLLLHPHGSSKADPRRGDRGSAPPRRGMRRVVRCAGRLLIAAGVLVMLFVAYQLWGTGLAERKGQDQLRAQFAEYVAPQPPTSPSAPPPLSTTATRAAPVPGEALALIQIPKLGLDKVAVEGVDVEDLKKGPGHYPGTALPGEAGNSAIAGHRTTFGAPFYALDELGPGDAILVTTRAGQFRYEVDRSMIVAPEDVSVLDPTPDNRLTLTTCHPRYSAAERLIVVARLVTPVAAAASVVEEPTPTFASPSPGLSARPGLSGPPADKVPAVSWGVLTALVALATWGLGRLWRRRWAAYLVGGPVFLVVLFMFYTEVAGLLPSSV